MSSSHERVSASNSTSIEPSRHQTRSDLSSPVVRATPRFFEDLDRQLRAERGPDGQPSTNDFQAFELIGIVDRFAVDFDDLPRLIPEREDYRVLMMSETLVPGFSVIGQLAVELVQLDIDTELDW